MIGIYVWTNKINNKKYIGQSRNILRRKQEHIRESLNECNDKILYKAIRKYGLNNFNFEVLEECSVEQLDEKEKFYISSLNTVVPNGYNVETGGQSSKESVSWTFFDKNKLLELYDLLQNSDMSFTDIGKHFGVSCSMIEQINKGEHYVTDGYSYPLRSNEKTKQISRNTISKKLQGENSYKCTISEETARLIISDLIDNKIRSNLIAEKYNTTIDVVKDINRGKSWKWIERPIPCRPDRGSAVLEEDLVFDIIGMLLDPTKDNDDIYALDSRISYRMIYRINKGENWKQDFLDYPLRKYVHKKGKLSLSQVLEIIELIHNTNLIFDDIAKKYNITSQSVSDINRHKIYGFLSEIYPNPIRSK